VIEPVVSFLIVALLCVGVALADVFARQISFELEPLRVLGDAFGVAGLFVLFALDAGLAFERRGFRYHRLWRSQSFQCDFQHMMANSTLPDSLCRLCGDETGKKA
jgi:hypothetical protein